MGINTKLKLIDAKIEQVSGGTLTFGGDNTIADTGSLQYASSPTGFVDESIVNKKYVDDSIIASAITANNGLTKSGGNITLGGALTGNTIIDIGDGSNYDFIITNDNFGEDFLYLKEYTGEYSFAFYPNVTDNKAGIFGHAGSGANVTLGVENDNSDVKRIEIYDSGNGASWYGIRVTDNQTGAKGMYYNDDYSDNFTPRSLVDKAYVTGLTSQGILTANNGLTKVGDNVVLGGALTGDTSITLTGSTAYDMDLSWDNEGLYYVNQKLSSDKGFYVSGGSAASTTRITFAVNAHASLICSYNDNSISCMSHNGGQIKVCGSGPNFHGIYYHADYESNFNNCSLVTKEYVDGATGSLSASNGLTRVGDNITLGGALTGDTAIDGTYGFDLGETTALREFNLTTTQNIDLTTGSGFAMNLNSGGQVVITSANNAGACFAADYSGSYNDCSIVDKKYVDDQITANEVTANNGLSKSNGNITLGGALTGGTSLVVTSTNDFSVNDALFCSQLYVNTDGISLDHIGTCVTLDGTAGNELLKLETADASLNLKTGVASTLDFSSGFTITDNAVTKVGLVYAADYKATFNDCSLVSKEYVDGATGSLSASNGLTRVEDDIILGGGLTGDTTISSASHDSCLIISSPMIANDVHNITFDEDPTFTDSVEGRLYYQNCAFNFDREISGVTLQLGEEMVIRVTNVTGSQIDNGAAVYGVATSNNLPTIAKSIATDETNAMKTVGLLTHDLLTNNEGYVVTQGIAHGVNTGAYTTGDILWLSTTVAGGYTNVRPSYPDSQVMLGRVLVVGTNDGSIYVKPLYIPPFTDYGVFTGYTASTQTDLDSKLDTTIFNGYSATTDGRLDVVEIVTDIAITGATDGLTKVGDHNVILGGTMTTDAVTIDGAFALTLAPSCDLILKATGDNTINIDAQSSGSVSLKSQSGVLTNPSSFTDAVGIFADFDQPGGFAVYDNRAGSNQTGIIYAADYSGDYVNRSLVDKAYVDSVATGLQAKAAVAVTTTDSDGNIDISGGTFVSGTTLDGIVVDDGWRVLIKNQTDAKQNGIFVYSASTSGFTRAEDYDGAPTGEINNGDLIPVITGDTWTSTQWILTTADPVVLGTDDLDFSLFSQLLQIGEGDGIDITSISGVQTISVELATNSALEFNGTGLSVANEIAGSGLTWVNGVVNVNACTVAPIGTEIAVRFGTADNLFVDGADFSYTTAANGLCKVGCNVTLGGNLTGDTVVDGSTLHDLSFVCLNDFALGFENATITDNGTTKVGLEYAGDYSGSFINESLVSKRYVDESITGSTHLTYDNGLTKHGDIVSWGGTLTGDTAILYNTANLCFLNGACSQIQMIADCSCSYVDATDIHINTCNSSGCISRFDLSDDGSLSITANNAATGLTITSAGVGAVYAADYSGTYVSRSLVDKAYVDSATGGIDASNGLTRVGDNITWGGTLTGDTLICGDGNSITFGGSTPASSFIVNVTGGMSLTTGSGNLILAASTGTILHNDIAAYDTDHSSEYGLRSIPDVEYVTGLTSQVLATANNGLTKVGQNVVLGGTLTGDTTLNGDSSYGLTLNNLTDFNVTFADSVITDTNAIPSGLVYAASYSGNFAKNSLVDKEYVTGLTSQAILTANNGLTKSGTNVVLGGALLGDIEFTGSAYHMWLGTQPSPINQLASFATGSIELRGTSTSNSSRLLLANGALLEAGSQTNDVTLNGGRNVVFTDYEVSHATVTTCIPFSIKATVDYGNGNGTDYGDVINQFRSDFTDDAVINALVELKADVDSIETVTANNGLTKSNSNVTLGGALTGDTSITGAFDLTLNNTTLNISGATTLASTLSLDATPSDGSISDSVLVWDSADKVVKKVSGSELGDPNNIYDTTTITTSTTLSTGSTYVIFVNHSAAVTVTLPPTPLDGQVFKIKDVTGDALTNNITVSGNGNNIDGAASGLINTDHGAFELIFDTTLDAWFSLSFIN